MAHQSYTVSSEHGAGNPQFTDIRDQEAQRGRSNETTSAPEEQFKFIPKALLVILSSTYCLIVLCVLLIIPILELAIGASYRDQCTINPNIPVYLIVTGACGMATILLTLVIVGAFVCIFKQGSSSGTIAIGCLIGVIVLIIFLMSIFLFAWFIAGNVWIFGAKKDVVMDDILSPNYCHRTLYEFAFTMLILTYVMGVISCCSSCCRSCFQVSKALKS